MEFHKKIYARIVGYESELVSWFCGILPSSARFRVEVIQRILNSFENGCQLIALGADRARHFDVVLAVGKNRLAIESRA